MLQHNQKIPLAIGYGDDVTEVCVPTKGWDWDEGVPLARRVMDVTTGTVSPLGMLTGGECGFLTKPVCINPHFLVRSSLEACLLILFMVLGRLLGGTVVVAINCSQQYYYS